MVGFTPRAGLSASGGRPSETKVLPSVLKTDGFGTRTRARARRFLPQKWECTEKLRVAEAGCRFRAESLSPTISPTHAREPNGNEVGDGKPGTRGFWLRG